MHHNVTFFKSCPLKEGQKIRIEDSPLSGDWEIIGLTPSRITLCCPVSKKEITKDRFLVFTEEKEAQWPRD
ncbi:MAG: hypothetical protein U9N77_09410 [Thermodesulfobacteriota bacterium]|nr:hypothetical protein [Thermodesulfobacteriota bacterium]